MSATVREQSHQSFGHAEVKSRKGWREILQRWTLRCPQCKQAWLVFGAKAIAQHTCKDCNHSFSAEFER